MQPRMITYRDAISLMEWTDVTEALRAGHLLPRAQVADVFLGPPEGTMLSRSAFIPGLGYGVKSVTVFGGNAAKGLPTVQGAMLVFEPDEGRLQAIIESQLVTELKTAGDSVLGAQLLARPGSRHLLIVGAGTVARSLVPAYCALFPGLERISVWARRPEQSEALAAGFEGTRVPVRAVTDLAAAAGEADIISSATMARAPLLQGAWIRPGTHVDLIGAFTKDMREADDALISGGALYVDSRETTIGHIGELTIPMAAGVIGAQDVLGDFYDLIGGTCPGRADDAQITVFKNGGGAHLDLMTARYIASRLAGD